MKSILIADTLYPEFLKTWKYLGSSSYEAERDAMLHRSFGTFDAYSRNLHELGWNTTDVIVNAAPLQAKWAKQFGCGSLDNVFAEQIDYYRPDVLFMQDLNVSLPIFRRKALLAGQCSCPMPPERLVAQYDVLFTSFPHYVPRFEALGVKGIYNPLAFDPIVFERLEDGHKRERWIDVAFVGGVGNPGHWQRGMQTLERVAREVPTFRWWGYGIETLPANSPLRDKYRGPAWGLDMYRIFRSAKIVLNRHGEVAEGYANNMRLFEATGCGAAVVTEAAPNLPEFFVTTGQLLEVVTYGSPDEAVEMIRLLLKAEDWRRAIAAAGQRRTLDQHTYRTGMQTVSYVLEELCPS